MKSNQIKYYSVRSDVCIAVHVLFSPAILLYHLPSTTCRLPPATYHPPLIAYRLSLWRFMLSFATSRRDSRCPEPFVENR